MNTEIKRSWLYKHSPQVLWEYLTRSEHIAKWLMPNDFLLEVGHEFTFTTNPIPDLNLSGTFYCKVLEIVPFKKLVYSWNGGLNKDAPSLETIVEWQLDAQENGTELRLYHHGFTDENNSILTAMYGGWDQHIQSMIKNINNKENAKA